MMQTVVIILIAKPYSNTMTNSPQQALQLGDCTLPTSVFTDHQLFIETVRAGISGQLVKQAIQAMGGNRQLFVRLLGTTSANLSRFYSKKTLDQADSEAVLDTLRLYQQAMTVLGDEQRARGWLSSELPALSGEQPWHLMDTFEGRRLVQAALRKIEYGEFS